MKKYFLTAIGNKPTVILGLLLMGFMITGCGKKEDVKSESMAQIYEKQGIPIKIKQVKLQRFSKTLTYNTSLSGNRQSVASAMMGGRIEKIKVVVGEKVVKDQVLMEFPKDAPSGKYLQAKAAYELSKKTLKRMSNLYKQGGIPKQQLDQVQTKYDVDKANWDAVKQMIEVRAPIAGIVTAINVNETDNVKRETVLATISDMKKVKGTIWATEEEAAQIRKGMPVQANYKKITLNGKINQIAMSLSRKHNAFRVEVIFDNPDLQYKSGVMADIKIDIYENPNAVVVARNLVQQDKKGKYVFIVKNNKAAKRYIQIGKQDNNFEIVQGLKTGDKLICEGLNLVKDGNKIKVTN